MAGRFKPKPRLNVQSSYLVYLWDVPVTLRGKDLKRKIDAQFGPVRFIETFEAWSSRPIGRMIVEFGGYSACEDFTEAMAAERVPYLQPPVNFQDLISIGKRQFFELIYRDTDVDLLACDGHPPSTDWNRDRARGAPRSVLPYARGTGGGSSSSGSARFSRRRSPSPTGDIGPFPPAAAPSNSSRIRRFLWNAGSGRCHILTVEEVEVKREPAEDEPEIILLDSSDSEEGGQGTAGGRNNRTNTTSSSGATSSSTTGPVKRCRSRSKSPADGFIGLGATAAVGTSATASRRRHPLLSTFVPPPSRHQPPPAPRSRSRTRPFVAASNNEGANPPQHPRSRLRSPGDYFANRRPHYVPPHPPAHFYQPQQQAAPRSRSRSRLVEIIDSNPNIATAARPRPRSRSRTPDCSFGFGSAASHLLRPRRPSASFRHQNNAKNNNFVPPPSRHEQHQQARARSRSQPRGGLPVIDAEPVPPPPPTPCCKSRDAPVTATTLRDRMYALFGPPPFVRPTGANAIPIGGAGDGPVDGGYRPRRHSFNPGWHPEAQGPKRCRTSMGGRGAGAGGGGWKRWRRGVAASTGSGTTNSADEIIILTDDDEGGALTAGRAQNNIAALSKGIMDVRLPGSPSSAEGGEIAEVDEQCQPPEQNSTQQQPEPDEMEEDEAEEWDEFVLLVDEPTAAAAEATTSTARDDEEEENMEEGDDEEEGKNTEEGDGRDDEEEQRDEEKNTEEDGNDEADYDEDAEIARLLDADDAEETVEDALAVDEVDEGILDSTVDGEEAEERAREAEAEEGGDVEEAGDEQADQQQSEEIVKSIRRMSLKKALARKEDQQMAGEEEVLEAEQCVLELKNLKRGFSLDRIRDALQTLGDVTCMVRTSDTSARFYCECSAARAARFLAEGIGERDRRELLGPGAEFEFSE